MKFKSKLVDTDTEIDYFVNPTLQELDTINSGYVRFVADNNSKQVYCWDGYFGTHSKGMYDLGMTYSDLWQLGRNMYLTGWAEKKGPFYVLGCVDTVEVLMEDAKAERGGDTVEVVDKILNVDWSWIENYSIKNVGSYMNELRGIWKKIKSKLPKQSKFYDADKKTEYFVNPDTAELDSLDAKYIRLIIDFDTKQVYVWDGDAIIHELASRNTLKLPGYPDRYRYHDGYAKKQGGKYIMQDYDNKEVYLQEYLKKKDESTYDYLYKTFLQHDWSWVTYYFELSKGIKDILAKVPVKQAHVRIRVVNKSINSREATFKIAKKLVTLAEGVLNEVPI